MIKSEKANQRSFPAKYLQSDLVIVGGGIFSAFVLVMGMLFARTGRNMKSFFAGGETLPWFIGSFRKCMIFFFYYCCKFFFWCML